MELWNWQIFWNELTLPALAASFVLWCLSMIAAWAWKHDRNIAFWCVVFFIMVTVIGLLFASLLPNNSIDSPRPYFTKARAEISRSLIKSNTTSPVYVLTVSVQNNEIPAKNVVSHLLILDGLLRSTTEPVTMDRIKNANDVGRLQYLNHRININIGRNARVAFVVFEIKYSSASGDDVYSQVWFMKFTGSSPDGKFDPPLVDASHAEREKIDEYIRLRNIPMLSDSWDEMNVQG